MAGGERERATCYKGGENCFHRDKYKCCDLQVTRHTERESDGDKRRKLWASLKARAGSREFQSPVNRSVCLSVRPSVRPSVRKVSFSSADDFYSSFTVNRNGSPESGLL